MKKAKADLCKTVKASEQDGLGTLVELFDWLDGLEPQPMMDESTCQGAVSTHLTYTFRFQITLVELCERFLPLSAGNLYSAGA